MKFIRSNIKILLHLFQFLLISLLLLRYSTAFSYIVDIGDIERVQSAKLIVEGKSLDSNESKDFILLKIDKILKGVSPQKTIAVYIWNMPKPEKVIRNGKVYIRENACGPPRFEVKRNDKLFLILNARKDISIDIRKSFDDSEISDYPLYSTLIYGKFHMDNDEIQAYKSIIQTLKLKDKVQRIARCKRAFKSRNEIIKRNAMVIISNETISEIEQLESLEEQERVTLDRLKESDNEVFIQWAIYVLTQHQSQLAYPYLLDRFDAMRLDDRDFRTYLWGLRRYKTNELGRILLKKLQDVDTTNYSHSSIGEIIGALEKDTLLVNREEYEEFLRGFVNKFEELLEYYDMWSDCYKEERVKFPVVYIRLFGLSKEEWSTKFLKDLYEESDRRAKWQILRNVIQALGKKEDRNAVSFLSKFLKKEKAVGEIFKALSSIGGDSASTMMTNYISEHKEDLSSTLLYDLPRAAQKSSKKSRKEVIDFLLDVSKSENEGIQLDALYSLGLIKDTEVTEFFIDNWDSLRVILKKLDCYDIFAGREESEIIPFLMKIINDPTEDEGIKSEALYALTKYDDIEAYEFIKEIAQSEQSIRIKYDAVLHVVKKNDKVRVAIYLNWLLKDHPLNIRIVKEEYFTDDELTQIYGSLLANYKGVYGKLSVEDRARFIYELRRKGHKYAASIYEIAVEDEDRYVREEATFALEELEEKRLK